MFPLCLNESSFIADSKSREISSLEPLPKVWKQLKNDYKLKEVIGVGGYGQVVRAVHKQSKRVVAIKFMDKIFENDYRAKQLIREIQIMRKLS